VTHFLPSSLDQRYVSDLIHISLELTITVIYEPELDSLKKNCVMSVERSTRDSVPPSPLAQRYVSG
jgi:hypothetical protein